MSGAIINLTPHGVTVVDEDGNTILEIPPSGITARVVPTQTVVGDINGVSIVRTVFGQVQGLPEPQEGVIYIVSSLVLQALAGARPDVVAPDTGPTCVRDKDGRIVAVRRFQVI